MNIPFIEKHINLNDYHFSYLEGGIESSSTPILFLPGWSVSTAPYQEILHSLSQRYQIIAPDLPGFGKSKSSKLIKNYQQYADSILDFALALNLKKCHLIGHSLGGAVGLTLAASMPSLVSSLIVVDSTGIPLESLPKVLLRRSVELTAQIGQAKLQPLSQLVQSFFSHCIFQTQQVIQSAWIAMENDVRPILSNVKSPCLVLWGENDQFTPLHLGQEIAQGIKGSQMRVIESGYHEWSLFQAEKFASIIFDFIEQVEVN